nr:retrovirus-related Pol polyprotein from transposon TNT 1-94 [Tanacetum cinerariifolium]
MHENAAGMPYRVSETPGNGETPRKQVDRLPLLVLGLLVANTNKWVFCLGFQVRRQHKKLLSRFVNSKGSSKEIDIRKLTVPSWSLVKARDFVHDKVIGQQVVPEKEVVYILHADWTKISKHIDEFNKIVLDLAYIEVKLEDEDIALLLLTSLLASYEHFVDTLLYGLEALTLEDVMATLNLKKIKERSKVKGDDGEGLYVRGRTDRRDSRQSMGKSRLKPRGGRLKRYIFQSEDHLKRNCSKNNRKKSTGYVKKDEQPSSSGSTYDDSEVMMVMSAQAQALPD